MGKFSDLFEDDDLFEDGDLFKGDSLFDDDDPKDEEYSSQDEDDNKDNFESDILEDIKKVYEEEDDSYGDPSKMLKTTIIIVVIGILGIILGIYVNKIKGINLKNSSNIEERAKTIENTGNTEVKSTDTYITTDYGYNNWRRVEKIDIDMADVFKEEKVLEVISFENHILKGNSDEFGILLKYVVKVRDTESDIIYYLDIPYELSNNLYEGLKFKCQYCFITVENNKILVDVIF